ncbi:hypothetical protein IR083_03910 [Dysgonomonas sp. GY75]|uniref:hypothetical protein n=1 Tax=Dysgonomonas sp. GY75 TaxID=2780419 RepID=UPI001883C774|nr:hypothetical protein [Dysgonomonas sp. GY75]MBF0647958.1 hypothetical protein [Dysgonomonas sp. GY75]
MEQDPKSEGKCLFCSKTFSKAGINRHLKTHLDGKILENAKGDSYLVKIETDPYYGSSPYSLSLWIDGETTMKNIDKFLREIWLECCGHLSAFNFASTRGRVSMSKKASEVFEKSLKLEYEYDFGSSTNLLLTVMEKYPVKADKKIVLLSRNEPLKWLCETCKKAQAIYICTVHGWDEDSMFCDKCAKKHAKQCDDFEDYAALPVVNSPRMGVCGYEGGKIDTERDGAMN